MKSKKLHINNDWNEKIELNLRLFFSLTNKKDDEHKNIAILPGNKDLTVKVDANRNAKDDIFLTECFESFSQAYESMLTELMPIMDGVSVLPQCGNEIIQNKMTTKELKKNDGYIGVTIKIKEGVNIHENLISRLLQENKQYDNMTIKSS